MKNRAIFIRFRRLISTGGVFHVGSDSGATGPEKDRPEVIIESEELMVEIDYIVLLFEDFDDKFLEMESSKTLVLSTYN